MRRGVKEVQKALRKGEKGLVVLAADVSPIDVTSHFPVFCEEKDVPYIFVTSREQLGQASSTRRPTSVAMIVLGGKSKDMNAAVEYKSTFDECLAQAKDLVCRVDSVLSSHVDSLAMSSFSQREQLAQ